MIRFTAEQEEFRKTVARFVDAEVVPVADALDERAEFPAGLFKRIGELGYFGLRYPEKYGGAASDMVTAGCCGAPRRGSPTRPWPTSSPSRPRRRPSAE